MSLRIEVMADRCTGCRSCAMTCSLRRAGEVRLSAAAIRIAARPDEGQFAPLVCVSCPQRSCVAACPVGAISDEGDTPRIDPALCVGCRRCVTACPYGAVGFDPVTRKAVKCDLCGGDPLCVRVCNAAGAMPGALSSSSEPLSPAALADAARRAQRAAEWTAGGADD